MKPISRAAISIVTWNHDQVIERCLQTLQQTVAPHHDVYVLDNASTDNTVTLVERYGYVTFIRQTTNTGFTGGNNSIWEKVSEQDYDYLVLVNPDTVHTSDWVSQLVEFMDAHPRVAIAQPKILLAQDPTKINTAGNALHYMGYSYCALQGQSDTVGQEPFPIAIASGAALIIRTNFLRAHGFFDNNFFAYHEDTDLSLRALQAGYEIYCVPTAQLQHEYVFSRSTKKLYYLERNRLYCIIKNFPLWYLILLAPTILLNESLMLVLALMSGWLGQKLRSYVDFLKIMPAALKQPHRPITRAMIKPVLAQLTWKVPIPDGVKVPKVGFKILNTYYWLNWSCIKLCLRLVKLS